MTVKATISTKGFDEWLEALQKRGANLDAVAADAVEAAGDVLVADMVELVPVDTGNLRDHLKVDGPHQDGNYHFAIVGLPRSTDAKTARYGTVQEYGSAHTHAQPYIRPALDKGKVKARKAMVQTFQEKLK